MLRVQVCVLVKDLDRIERDRRGSIVDAGAQKAGADLNRQFR